MLPYCVKYGRTILIALVPFMLMNIFQSFLVTAELPHYGLIITIASGVVNVILDALFVAVFKFGVIGAAVATGISQAIGGFIPLFIFIFQRRANCTLAGRTSAKSSSQILCKRFFRIYVQCSRFTRKYVIQLAVNEITWT